MKILTNKANEQMGTKIEKMTWRFYFIIINFPWLNPDLVFCMEKFEFVDEIQRDLSSVFVWLRVSLRMNEWTRKSEVFFFVHLFSERKRKYFGDFKIKIVLEPKTLRSGHGIDHSIPSLFPWNIAERLHREVLIERYTFQTSR